MGKLPKITIVTPSFNQGRYIERTIRSVLEQNYPNIEYIIIDGHSTDQTVDIIKKYEGRIKYWVNEPDEGQSDAINKGLKHATGDIINWLNSDDWLTENALFKVAECFKDKDIDIVCGYSAMIFSDETAKKKRSTRPYSPWSKFLSYAQIVQPSTFWRFSVFSQFTPVNTTLNYTMDHYMWMQYLVAFGGDSIYYSNHELAGILMHANAKSVGQLLKFDSDKLRIIDGLCNSLVNSNVTRDPNADLTFQITNSSPVSSTDARMIKFHSLFRELFQWDHKGERGPLNRDKLKQLISRFPLELMKETIPLLINKIR